MINTKVLYNYKSTDDALDTRITALEGKVGESSVESQIQALSERHDTEIAALQAQIDENITTYFEEGVPTLTSAPASAWDTEAKKNQHLGDVYYDTNSGFAYRFMVTQTGEGEEAGKTYSWGLIKDSEVTKALSDAADAQSAADDAQSTADDAYDLAEAAVSKKQGTFNAGHLLWVGDDGMVTNQIPSFLLITDTASKKTYTISLNENAELQVSEVTGTGDGE